MKTDNEADIYSAADLRALAGCDDEQVREWALRYLTMISGGAAHDVMRANLTHPSARVRQCAIDGFKTGALDEASLEALRTTSRERDAAFEEGARTATSFLAQHGDAEAIAAELARLTRGETLDAALFEALLVSHGDAMREAVREAARSSTTRERATWLARVATADDLPWFFDEAPPAEERALRRAAVARMVWVDLLVSATLSNRDWAQHLDALRVLAERDWEYPDAAHATLRRVALGYLNPDAWKKPLSALRSRQWWHVIEEASLVWARLSPGPRAPTPPLFAEVFAALSQVRAPDQHDAGLALSLALGAVQRALMGHLDLATSDLARTLLWMAAQGPRTLIHTLPQLHARWISAPPESPAHAEAARTLIDAMGWKPSSLRVTALTLLSRLSDAPLDVATVLSSPPPNALDASLWYSIVRGRPALLRACAEEALRTEGHPLRDGMLGELVAASEPWAADLLIATMPSLRREEALYGVAARLLASLGDMRALDAIAASAPRPHGAGVIEAMSFLLALSARRSALPGNVEHPLALRVAGDGPLAVRLRCNRCGALATHDVGAARVHPDLSACERDGWDGVVFDRVVTCACGAEDDYTLSPAQRFALIEGIKDELTPVYRERVEAPDKSPVRRRGALLATLRADAEARPDDSVAWERLGDALRDAARLDEAVVAWRRSMAASPDNVSVVTGYVVALEDAGDREGADALVDELLARWPKGRAVFEDAAAQADDIVAAFDRWVERRGAPLTLVFELSPVEGLAPPPLAEAAIPLHRPRHRADAKALLLDPRLTGLRLTRDDPSDPTALEALLAKTPFAFVTKPLLKPADEHRLGRNDPCHCGSGKKYKKCHGA